MFDSVIHTSLKQGFQKSIRNLNTTMSFYGQSKTGQNIPAGWARLAVLVAQNVNRVISISCNFFFTFKLQYGQVNIELI